MQSEKFTSLKNSIAVVGVSANPEKWGRKIFDELKKQGFKVFAVNPKYKKIGNNNCFQSLKSLPLKPDIVITVVPPKATMQTVKECSELGIKRVWMQPGSESKEAIEYCKEKGIEAIFNACFVMDGLKKSG